MNGGVAIGSTVSTSSKIDAIRVQDTRARKMSPEAQYRDIIRHTEGSVLMLLEKLNYPGVVG